jgi:hypothetical protein
MKNLWFATIAVSSIFSNALAGNLDDEAKQYGTNYTSQMWLINNNDYWIYYSIPPNNFTTNLGQDGPIMRFVEARDVSWNIIPKYLTEADRLNGLEWQGSVTMTAKVAHEYDCAGGWQPWINKVSLIADYIEKRNGTWYGRYQFQLNVPGNTTFQTPDLDWLPSPNAGVKDGPICNGLPLQQQQQQPQPQPTPPPPLQQGCGIRHNPDGSVSGRACYN